MFDLGSIQAALGSIKVAGDIASSMKNLADAAKLQSATIELQQAILDAQSGALNAQSDQSALIDRVRDLEEEIAGMKAWGAEKERYALNEIGNGCLAYSLKEPSDSPEPEHHLCANCFNHGQKSILQPETRVPGRVKVLVCHNCSGELMLTGRVRPEHRPKVITRKPR